MHKLNWSGGSLQTYKKQTGAFVAVLTLLQSDSEPGFFQHVHEAKACGKAFDLPNHLKWGTKICKDFLLLTDL